MTMTSYPKVGGSTTDAQFAEFFNSIIGTGVRDASGLVVSGDSSGMNVKVSTGFAVVAGCAFLSTAVEALTIAPNASGSVRVDTIVLARDYTAPATVTLKVKTGPGGASAPALTQSVTGLWEEPLADVLVANAAATIVPSNVTDRRHLLASNVQSFTKGARPTGRLALFGYDDATKRWVGHVGDKWVSLIDSEQIAIQPARPTSPAPDTIHMY